MSSIYIQEIDLYNYNYIEDIVLSKNRASGGRESYSAS